MYSLAFFKQNIFLKETLSEFFFSTLSISCCSNDLGGVIIKSNSITKNQILKAMVSYFMWALKSKVDGGRKMIIADSEILADNVNIFHNILYIMMISYLKIDFMV